MHPDKTSTNNNNNNNNNNSVSAILVIHCFSKKIFKDSNNNNFSQIKAGNLEHELFIFQNMKI